MNKRFIEDSFPVKEVSIESAREKNIRHGHISTLHIWWARRPLASSRATNYAALIHLPYKYLFNWEEITENDIVNLTHDLEFNYDADWIKTAEITKTANDKTIMITAGEKFFSLNLNNENTELNLKIDNGKTDTFIVKTENGKPNIYSVNKDECKKTRQFIIDFSKWENSLNPTLIEKAREDILKANKGVPPKVLDPFGGGGTIPLEALRLGCETYSNDLNPVAVLIQKCALEYPQKYGRQRGGKEGWGELSGSKSPLLEDVKKWGEWVQEQARKEIGRFFPEEPDGLIPVGYIWARTIPCQNPSCGIEIPLMRQYWLAKKDKKRVSLFPYIEDRKVKFRIVGDGYEKMPEDFDPEKGTISIAIATCPVCGSVVDAKTTRKLFQEGKAGQKMIVVVLHHPKKQGKTYRIYNEEDIRIFRFAESYLRDKREKLMMKWGMDPVPDEVIHTPDGKEYKPGNLLYNFTPVVLYGVTKWGDLFNSRQKLALITFVEIVRKAYEKMLDYGYNEEYAKAVVSFLGILLDGIVDHNSALCQWRGGTEDGGHTFGRQALIYDMGLF